MTIPNSVKSIGYAAFDICPDLKYISIGDSVTSIGERAFRGSGLKSVTIPDSVTSIGVSAFESSKALQNVIVGINSSILINDYAFKDCSDLISISFGTISEIDIDTGAFQGCNKLEQLYLNKSVTIISGLPAGFVERYYCNNGTCGCKDGYGNNYDNTSSLYRCEACPKGKTSNGGVK